jgi:DNA-directed RNA polymerase subunit H (RpoH/RPB5)
MAGAAAKKDDVKELIDYVEEQKNPKRLEIAKYNRHLLLKTFEMLKTHRKYPIPDHWITKVQETTPEKFDDYIGGLMTNPRSFLERTVLELVASTVKRSKESSSTGDNTGLRGLMSMIVPNKFVTRAAPAARVAPASDSDSGSGSVGGGRRGSVSSSVSVAAPVAAAAAPSVNKFPAKFSLVLFLEHENATSTNVQKTAKQHMTAIGALIAPINSVLLAYGKKLRSEAAAAAAAAAPAPAAAAAPAAELPTAAEAAREAVKRQEREDAAAIADTRKLVSEIIVIVPPPTSTTTFKTLLQAAQTSGSGVASGASASGGGDQRDHLFTNIPIKTVVFTDLEILKPPMHLLLQSKYNALTQEEVKELCESNPMFVPSRLPKLCMHSDPVIKYLGFPAKTIVEISRLSLLPRSCPGPAADGADGGGGDLVYAEVING